MSIPIFHKSFFKKITFCIVYLVLFTFLGSAVYASNNDDEDYFTPNFRSGHNLSLFLSGEYTTWGANQASVPSTPSNTSDTPEQINDKVKAVTIDAAQGNKAVIALFFRYSYHINIISSFGFFVGSTVGILASNGSYGAQKNFYPGYGISFPTVLGGLVQGIGQNFRILSGIEYGAVWFPKMRIYTQSGIEKDLSPVPDMFGFFGGIDNFLSRNTAISLNVGYRQIHNPCLNACSNSLYLNSLSITNKSYYTQLGITWLLGTAAISQ